jgi:prepilin-type N-terminal cleavage/methylation domain-containing protein
MRRRGFTLIEVLVIVVVLLIVAALAIPGLLSSQRASNERGASAALKTLASAEADFRGNDRDGNMIQDFWTRDVAGLYAVVPLGKREMIKLIDISVARADFAAAGTASPGVRGLEVVDQNSYAPPAPLQGYWFQRMLADETGSSYQTNTNGIVRDAAGGESKVSWWNASKFGFYAFPDAWKTGRVVYFINEGNTIFKRAMNGPVIPDAAMPNPSGVKLLYGKQGLVGDQVPEVWPNDSVLKAEFFGCGDCCK